MRLRLAYGDGLWVTLPDGVDVTVIEPEYVPGVADEGVALRRGLASPLGCPSLADLVRPQDTVTIVFSDITRPMPNDRVLPVLVNALVKTGIPEAHITLLNGLGTHRAQSADELRTMLGNSSWSVSRSFSTMPG